MTGRTVGETAPSDGGRPTVGLALIARDEERTLPRLLAGCDGAFDEVVLIDTGSVDGTIGRFERWAETQPATHCHVGHFTWIDDFAAARQAAFDALSTDWCCWADCDDVLTGAGALRGLAARAAAGVVAIAGRYDYGPGENARHIRLVRAAAARWEGEIHESLSVVATDGRIENAPDDVLRWTHLPIRSGDAKPRLRKDLEILERQVAANPEDPRAVFYLAQTRRDLGDRAGAIETYQRRVALTGYDEEQFWAAYQLGVLLLEETWSDGMTALMEAWELRPTRMEPVQRLSAEYRLRGMYRIAHALATAGRDAQRPDDWLFIADWVYDWGMLFEYSITSYWVGDYAAALAACNRLLQRDDLPALHRSQTVANRRYAASGVARRAVARGSRTYRAPSGRSSSTRRGAGATGTTDA
jgi:glycosyltransferase involved in cell wall biosynthesis